jgi:hypothetical protein
VKTIYHRGRRGRREKTEVSRGVGVQVVVRLVVMNFLYSPVLELCGECENAPSHRDGGVARYIPALDAEQSVDCARAFHGARDVARQFVGGA